jgi:rhodanese-related sulfurtransferase
VPPHTTEATETSPNPDDVSVVEDSIVISAPEESIYTVDVSTFSWEIGIRQTQIIDVRTLTEYKEGHIYDAINMSVDDPSFVHQIQTLDKNSPVAVYCRSGIRSIHAAKILKDNGFRIIYNLNGGLNQWIKNGKEIIK